jgi:hypothetical protein
VTVDIQNDRVELLEIFQNPEYWETLEDDVKKEIFRALIKEIIIKDGEVLCVNLLI